MGIAMKANMLVVFIQLGIGIGIQPLVGFHYGARNFTKMTKWYGSAWSAPWCWG